MFSSEDYLQYDFSLDNYTTKIFLPGDKGTASYYTAVHPDINYAALPGQV